MTEETQVQSDIQNVQSNEAQSTENQQTEEVVVTRSAEELAKRLKEVSLEAKTNRQKYAEEKRKREDLEKTKLQEQGQFKELSDIWQRKATEAESQANKLKQAFAYKTVTDTIAMEATRMGCIDPEAIVALLPLDNVPIDETFNVDRTSVKAMIEDFRKTKPYFFQKPAPAMANGTPAKPQPPEMDLSKMSLADRAALLVQLKNQGK